MMPAAATPVLKARPPLPPLQPAWDKALTVGLVSLGLFVPFSTTGVTLSLSFLLLLALALLPQGWRCAAWREPVWACGLLLLVLISVRTVAASGWSWASGQAINRYHELLMAPVLWTLFRLVSRPRVFMQAFLIAALLYAAVFWLALARPEWVLALRPRRISAGFVFAISAFLLSWPASGHAWPRAPARLAAAFLAATVLLAMDGRTGPVVLLVLGAWSAWQAAPRRWRWLGAAAVPVALALVLALSPGGQQRVQETLAGRALQSNGQLSPTGVRIDLLHSGIALAAQHAGLGVGYGSYALAHQQALPQAIATDNPHNEYLMQLTCGGVAALVLFVAWLAWPAWQLAGQPQRTVAIGLALAFGVGCLFNSMLMDFVEGHVYACVLAWLLAHNGSRKQQNFRETP